MFQNTEGDLSFGPMRIPQKPITILLVFSKEDSQSEALWQAAQRLGYTCSLALTPEAALEEFLQRHHDIIFIDRRSSKAFDADTLCSQSDKEEPSILPMLKAGFNRLTYTEVRNQRKLKACAALITALDSVSDAVEITNDCHTIQYVNHMYERITGFTNDELVGKDAREMSRSDRNKDVHDTIAAQAKKGKQFWEGTYYTRRKSGDTIPYHCRVTPVMGPGGRESVARIHSTMIEAPITKVINMINAAQESSPLTVAQALDKVLEILRTSELYAPYLPPLGRDDDPMTTDLVGGLVSQNMKRRLSGHDVPPHRQSQPHSHHSTGAPPGSLSQIPDHVAAILEKEPTWAFDIIQLEEATNKRTSGDSDRVLFGEEADLGDVTRPWEGFSCSLDLPSKLIGQRVMLLGGIRAGGSPLVYLGLKTFSRFGVCEFLGISEAVLVHWLQVIEENYHSENHYHNSTHAADVLHASAYFLECERTKSVFDAADCVACLIAATVHDVDHPAKTNAFLVNESNQLALLYNDLAVLESHHASMAFRLTHKDPSVNIFQKLSREDYQSLRQSIVDMVLATEMKQHFEHLSKFTNSINKSVLKCDEADSEACTGSFDNESVIAQLATPENRTLIKRMLIKCADVSNPVRPKELCIAWAERIAEEYCSQTDEEKAKGLPVVMPVFDRKTCSIPKSQTSFIDVFINDMFDAWDYYCDIRELMDHLQTNYRYWKDKEEEERLAKAKDGNPAPLSAKDGNS
ncbi:hypothetical protein BaRGS_00016099 [Batillaria attramentaria]|uniref:Phosphodiesterase n=1 Tax=Batillaria attramentaria TaxID=370345 RepID=A0ABD0KZH8_9CAEN